MEREKKQSKQEIEERPEYLRDHVGKGQASKVVQPSAVAPRVSMVAVADSMFDLHLSEKQGEKPVFLSSAIATLPGLEDLIAILGPCMIPGCDVHVLSSDKGADPLESGSGGVGMRILTHVRDLFPHRVSSRAC